MLGASDVAYLTPIVHILQQLLTSPKRQLHLKRRTSLATYCEQFANAVSVVIKYVSRGREKIIFLFYTI